jgi:hypothetical protein
MRESISVKFLEFYIQGYLTSDNEPDGTENATHTTFLKKRATEIIFFFNVLWVAFNFVVLIITREIPCTYKVIHRRVRPKM